MNTINIDVVPVLPLNGIYAGECVAMGMFDNGVVISYLTKNVAVLHTWDELALAGIKFIEHPPEEKEPEPGATREFTQ